MALHAPWEVLEGHTSKSLMQDILVDTKKHAIGGALPVVEVERKPTARESVGDFFTLVPKMLTEGEYRGQHIPKYSIFRMPGVGIVLRDCSAQKIMGHDSCWDLVAQEDANSRGESINVWALHVEGKCVAKTSILKRVANNVKVMGRQTHRFTFANTNTEVVPTMNNWNTDYEIIFLDMVDGGKETKVKIENEETMTMKMLCSQYAKKLDKDIKSLRFSYGGKSLFLSSIGKKLPAQLGLNNLDVILVTYESAFDEDYDTTNEKNKAIGKSGRKKNKGKCGKKKSGPRPVIEVRKSDKEEHSKVFSHVLKEAEPLFKDIRQKIQALTLERTQPKQKVPAKKNTDDAPQDKPICSPITDDQCNSKAGRSYYIVLVGEVSNLYKTAKNGARKQRTRSLDLKGLKAHEALVALDKNLAKWIDIAMSGSYPFVIPVAVICGGGNQVLSEVVQKWIRSNKQVANAPKNYFG